MRRVTQRRPKVNLKMRALAVSMLDQAQTIFDQSADLDTAVRDTVAEGLAFIVHSAYDTQSIAECVSDFDCIEYIQAKTYEWFRERGFVEWFCVGASSLFKTSPRNFFRYKVTPGKKVTRIKREKVA